MTTCPTRRDMLAAATAFGVAGPALSAPEALHREDLFTVSDDGFRLHAREVRPAAPHGASPGAPLILLHGARAPGVASFDLPVAGGSLAGDLAQRLNRRVYVMDARGYGASQRPAAMGRPPEQSRPLSRAFEVVRDIEAVRKLAALRSKDGGSGSRQVGLIGWATGGLWAGFYAALRPESVAGLATINALYGGSDVHPMLGPGSAVAQPGQPRRFDPTTGGYALYPAASLIGVWERNIPVADKDAWRDPALARALAAAVLASDPDSGRHDPPRFRAPLGALEDSFYQACGRRLYDAGSITAPVLLLRSERDFWSRPADLDAFVADAGRSPSVKAVTLAGATHFVHLDRPDRGRDRLLAELIDHFGGIRA
ncbi:alpha/beta hydrolase [Caulobacter sp. Root1455]|uniref:alpha/beta fold hydrolase n=1 Tax=unclassified Caulobacter TaxID=2648921 RepID=UPI0006FA7517|nr:MULTISPECIES: alpha/beta fold hydrolase [unclassified Caulobacter]KQY30131.1 alpha/beta hydrolase [Caulobacter sp. Root487D2Y]KQY92431.1 alpha/beta hydrolase [Caulobacter sp. Root1455]